KAAHNPGSFVNKDTGEVIRVNADTKYKAASFAVSTIKKKESRVKARQHMELLQHIGKLAEEAVLVSESQDAKGRPGEWEYYFSEAEIEGKQFLVKLEVKKDKGGGVVHNYVVIDPRGLAKPSSES